MTHFDLTPAGARSPKVRLYDDSLEIGARTQQHATEAAHVQSGGSDDHKRSTRTGLDPGVLPLHGYFLGSDAETLADRLRTIIDDLDTERVDLQAVDDNGTNQASPHNGTYRLTDNQELTQPDSTTTLVWEYRLRLMED